MTEILKLVLDDVFSLGANDSIILKSNEIILINDYPLHSKEREHLRRLAGWHLDSLLKKSEKETTNLPLHYLHYDDNSKVRCSAHLGMIAAAFEAHGGEGDRVGLVPFAEDGGCLATFAASGGSA